jgi:predicted aspartyl protease
MEREAREEEVFLTRLAQVELRIAETSASLEVQRRIIAVLESDGLQAPIQFSHRRLEQLTRTHKAHLSDRTRILDHLTALRRNL